MTDADRLMNPQHFKTNLVDIWIRIRVNPKIRMQIVDHFLLRLDAVLEVCDLCAQSSWTFNTSVMYTV